MRRRREPITHYPDYICRALDGERFMGRGAGSGCGDDLSEGDGITLDATRVTCARCTQYIARRAARMLEGPGSWEEVG